ncbi:hypothetical protein A2609_02060 [Candidatus Kaiserbacteria bacterium RIFOXYD1_FULL_47_14]|uniref:Uncharacterized protein n=1 Tax=Candidatus Kaiserbacteria bacterium RIFOXYD1_FULL_47_14 TaxID=1798533 RepID=A0A1F6G4G9_9BACT|nr:MAG: hypothetical protein A2609_02060 [Candidatus Kaiserbacteria bacterium RIFOXYD1_FULL_47_14]
MRKDKGIAFNLRRSGKSYTEIRDTLKIPVSTLSDWFSKVDWSKQLKGKLASKMQEQHTIRIVELNKIRGQHLEKAYEEAREEARKEFDAMKYNPLFIAGLMLYWGEGDKLTKHLTKIANTDPNLIRLYVFFLKKVCRIPEGKIKAQILVYPDLNEENCRRYWSRESGVDLKYFTKSSTIQGRHKTRRIAYGVCMVCISSTYFKVKVLEWLKLLSRELMNEAYYAKI